MTTCSQSVTGTLSRFIYKKDGFAIFKLKSGSEEITALGGLSGVSEGEKIHVTGSWENNPNYGRQFKIDSWEKIIPTDKESAVELLSSGIIKGVGPATAQRIVNTLGPNALEIILENPSELIKVKGMGRKKAPEIARIILETYDMQRVVKELVSIGMTPNTAHKVYKQFGRSAAEYVKLNPYCLTKVEQIGFKKADEIAQRIGIKRDSRFRVQAGILFVLNEALWNDGHIYLPVNEVVSRSLEILNKEYDDVTREQVMKNLNHEEIEIHEYGLSLTWALECERKVAANINRLRGRLSNFDPAPLIMWYERKERIKLTEEQKKAVAMALNSGLSILTGGPGVGKTATVKAIITVFEKMFPGIPIELAAPTGRAARRMAEATGRNASTIHKLLGIGHDGKPAHNKTNLLEAGLIVIDEISMSDVILTNNILSAIKKGTRVLLVGDPDQLPSVGPGNVLRDMLKTSIPRVTLDKIFRQAAESQIITNAHRINKGLPLMIDRFKNDFDFIEREDPEEITRSVVHHVKELGYAIEDLQVLAPMKKTPIGTQELNRMIQEVINPENEELRLANSVFRVGDKVIQTKNNYEKQVYNGDIGVIKAIEGNTVRVAFNGNIVEYTNGELRDLELAYAVTIHKSQGSEFKAVIVPLSTSNYVMLTRNLLYTAVTRAKEKIILIGTKKALAIAIKNNKPVQRNTMLAGMIE